MPLPMPDLYAALPELIMTALICLVVLIDLVIPKRHKSAVGLISLAGVLIAVIPTIGLIGQTISTFSGMFLVDGFAVFFKLVFLTVTALTILISLRYLQIEEINLGEYYALLLFATTGMMIMAAGGDLISIYLGLELNALSTYVLAGFIKNDAKSTEAALKYFLMGAFTSGVILYGMALLYGLTGTTNLQGIAAYLTRHQLQHNPVLILAMILLVAGFGFKIAAVPFHMWVPDVYEGAPTSVSAFFAVGPKAAGFAAILRIFMVAISPMRPQWTVLLWVLSALTMVVGNLVAIAQTSFKRMLAYSSIGHAGYVLIGLVAASELGLASVLLYVLVYAFMNMGAFAMVILMCKKGQRDDQIADFTGLARTNPWAAFALVIFFLSLAGIPPTGGFVGKFYIFAAAIEAKLFWLTVIGVLTSTVSVYYYFRVTMLMYMREPPRPITLSVSPSLVLALALMVAATLAIGIYPRPFIDAARASIVSLL